MDDLISRQSVIDLMEEWSGGYAYIEVETVGAISDIKQIPSASKLLLDRLYEIMKKISAEKESISKSARLSLLRLIIDEIERI